MPGFDDPLIDPLEPAADDQGAGPGGQFRHKRLGQWPTPRAHQEARTALVDIRGIDRCRQHIGPQHHARTAAGRCVIDAAVAIGGGIPDVARLQLPQA